MNNKIIIAIISLLVIFTIFMYFKYKKSNITPNIYPVLEKSEGLWKDNTDLHLFVEPISNTDTVHIQFIPGKIADPFTITSYDSNSFSILTQNKPMRQNITQKYTYHDQTNQLEYNLSYTTFDNDKPVQFKNILFNRVPTINITDSSFDKNILNFNGTWNNKENNFIIKIKNNMVINVNDVQDLYTYSNNTLVAKELNYTFVNNNNGTLTFTSEGKTSILTKTN